MRSSHLNAEAQIARAIDDTRHWLLQAVVGLNLCPFAKSVVVKDLVRYVGPARRRRATPPC